MTSSPDGSQPAMTPVSSRRAKRPQLQLIAAQIIESGYEIACPEWEHDSFLKVTNAALALCELTLGDQTAEWTYQPFRSHQGGPDQAAAMVAAILDPGDKARLADPARENPGHPLLDAVRRRLAGSGLRFGWLDLTADGSYAAIVVENSALPGRGTVYLSDDHAITWRFRYADQDGGTTGLDPNEIAGTITRALGATGGQQPCRVMETMASGQ